MNALEVPIKLSSDQAKIPQYMRPGDAALDLCSIKEISLKPFERILIPTGIHVAIPENYAGLILPRSGLAYKKGLSLVNSPGLVDSNFRGEIQVIAINLDPKKDIFVHIHDRIAQFLLIQVDQLTFFECSNLENTVRGESGFGSSGV